MPAGWKKLEIKVRKKGVKFTSVGDKPVYSKKSKSINYKMYKQKENSR